MRVHVRSVLSIASVLGGKEHNIDADDGAAVEDVIDFLIKKHGEPLKELLLRNDDPMELLPYVKIYVNGRGLDFLNGLETGLRDGDDVMLMPQISGG